jgi:hypothetical protein
VTEHGRYLVTGRREYRGHQPGEMFIARLARNAEGRAVQRGDIALLERVTPQLPARWWLPAGWSATNRKE